MASDVVLACFRRILVKSTSPIMEKILHVVCSVLPFPACDLNG